MDGTVLSSVAAAAIVTAVATLMGQHFERTARAREKKEEQEFRKKEMLFTNALSLAKEKVESQLALAKQENRTCDIPGTITMAGYQYQLLLHLYEKGDLPMDHYLTMQMELDEKVRNREEHFEERYELGSEAGKEKYKLALELAVTEIAKRTRENPSEIERVLLANADWYLKDPKNKSVYESVRK